MSLSLFTGKWRRREPHTAPVADRLLVALVNEARTDAELRRILWRRARHRS